MCKNTRMKNIPFSSLFIIFLFFSSIIDLSLAAETRSIPETIFVADGIKSRVPSSQINTECFIAPGISKNSYLGIWCNGEHDDNRVVWLAKRDDSFVRFINVLNTGNLHQLCVTSFSLGCEDGDWFIKQHGMKLLDLIDVAPSESHLKECEAECLKNSNCRAYANPTSNDGSIGCNKMWFADPIASTKSTQNDNMGVDLNRKKSQKSTILLVSIISASVVIILGIMSCIIWKKKKAHLTGQESIMEDLEVTLFDLSTIAAATNNFSQENLIGAGGFGPVYKGNLSTGEEIAVKRLSKNSRQGTEEFRNEVILIAKLQHKNLVGLLGSCIQGEERLLIYEYMSNKSLDYFIFDQKNATLLTWRKRFDIILGIARGLLYLHQDSKLQIIHRDLKAGNILLDNDMNPKISDFGLARIFRGDDDAAKTNRVVGTYGYMSPEYAIDGTFSVRSDVFSFGVLLLEIVSGKKNRGFSHPAHNHNLLGHAWLLWDGSRALELMDPCLEDSCNKSQVLRCIHVGLLCVQKFPEERPAMSSVVFMLANKEAKLPQPRQPGFFMERNCVNTDSKSTNQEPLTVNAVTISMLEGR